MIHFLSLAGDIVFTSVTYRLFKLSKVAERSPAVVTYNGSLEEYEKELPFDQENTFKVGIDWCFIPGGVTRHMTGYAPVSKKSVKRVCFSAIRCRRRFPLKRGVFSVSIAL